MKARLRAMVTAGAMAAVWLACAPAAAEAATLDRVRDSGMFRIGYRSDAKPYSYRNENGQPAGYIVDLCMEVATAVRAERRRQHPDGVRAGARGPTLRVGARRQGRHALRSEFGDDAAPRAGRLLTADVPRRRQRAVPDQETGGPFRGSRRQANRRARRHHHRADAARVVGRAQSQGRNHSGPRSSRRHRSFVRATRSTPISPTAPSSPPSSTKAAGPASRSAGNISATKPTRSLCRATTARSGCWSTARWRGFTAAAGSTPSSPRPSARRRRTTCSRP